MPTPLLALGLAHFGLQGVAGLLGVAQQHGRVGLVEDGVVHGGVSYAQRTLHHNHLAKARIFFFFFKVNSCIGITHARHCKAEKATRVLTECPNLWDRVTMTM